MSTKCVAKDDIEIVRDSDLFDPEWYLATYQDVCYLRMDPAEHYLRLGARLRRNPSSRFDTEKYLEMNPDVADAGINPLLSYLTESKRALYAEGDRNPAGGPTINWVMNADNVGWAYGNNAQLLSERLTGFRHLIDEPVRISDVAVYFDIKIFKMRGLLGRKNILRVGGPRPIQLTYGNDHARLREDIAIFDAIVVLNSYLYEMFAPLHHRVHLVPNALDLQAWKQDHTHSSKRNDFVIGFAGNLATRKERMIKGFNLARDACERLGVRLVHFTKGEAQISREDMRSRFYGNIDCLVHPVAAGKEGCSNVIMEALAMGVPVVTTRDAGYHAERIADGEGVLYCNRNSADIAEKIDRLRLDADLRGRMRKSAREFAERFHDIRLVADKYNSLIATLTGDVKGLRVSFVPFWVPVKDFASSRLRCENPARLLSGNPAFKARVGYHADAQVVVVSQLASDETYQALISTPHVFVVYDVCDRYFVDEREIGGVHAKRRFFQLAKRADIIVASTVMLKQEMEQLGLLKPIIYIPDGIDYQDRRNPDPTPAGRPVVWFGNPGRGNFESSRWMIDHVMRSTATGMRIISRRRYFTNLARRDSKEYGGYVDSCVDWNCDSFVEDLRGNSLCVLSHSEDEKSKSPNRLITAVANGVPVICSNAPSCEELLRSAGMDFAIVKNEADLSAAIDRLSQPAERERYLEMMQDLVEARFGERAMRERYEQLLSQHCYERTLVPEVPLRVLFVSHNLSVGEGAPTSLMQMVLGLRDIYGVQPLVYALVGGGLLEQYEKAGVPVILPDFGRRSRLATNVLSRAYPEVERGFRALVRKHRIDVIVSNTAKCLCFADLAESLRVPAVSIVRESSEEHLSLSFGSGPFIDASRRTLKGKQTIAFVSEETRRLWSDAHRLMRTVLIPNGIDVSRFERVRKMAPEQARIELGRAPDELILLSVGTINERKAQMDIVEAFAALPSTVRKDARLALVGAKPSEYLTRLRKRIAELETELADRILLVSETEDVALWYRSASVFLFSSRNESYPRVVVEAMYFGLPIVSSAVFGTQEQIVDGASGLLYPPGKVEALRVHLESLLVDDGERARLALGAESRYWELTSYQEMLHRYYTLLRNSVDVERPRIPVTESLHYAHR